LPSAIVLLTPEVEEGLTQITVAGSGWQPDEVVVVEIRGPDDYAIFVKGPTADGGGAFKVSGGPKSLGKGIEPRPLMPGIYTVVALGSEGGAASAPLIVTEKAQ